MTIEEAKGIEANPKEYSKWKLSDAQKFRRAWVKGYEAKEEELKGALIIPEGWDYLRTYWSDVDGLYKSAWANSGIWLRIYGIGDTEHEALRNALEQIKTK